MLLAEFDVSPAQWGRLEQLEFEQPVDLLKLAPTRVHMEAMVRQQVEGEERARLARKGKPTPRRDRENQIRLQVDRRLVLQPVAAANAVRNGLLQRIKQLLRAWRVQPQTLAGLKGGGNIGAPENFNVQCFGSGDKRCGHVFMRKDLESVASIRCPRCKMEQRVVDLLAAQDVRQCPSCAINGVAAVGCFSARKCRLQIGEGLKKRSYTMQCKACGEEVNLFDVFPPEVYGSFHSLAKSLQEQVNNLIKAIEVEADVLVWTTRRERGGVPDVESRRALAMSQVVLLFVTDEFAASPDCAAEVHEAIKTGKLVVPLLLPGLTLEEFQLPSLRELGQQHPEELEEFWLRLATHRRQRLRFDALDWTLLSDRAPLVVSTEMFQNSVTRASDEEGTYSRFSNFACQVAARISSRLHRAVKMAVFSDLSRFGVRLSYFHTFIKMCGGRPVLEKLTTYEVMHSFVKPLTEASQLSLCEQLISDGGEGAAFVSTARVFLSHAWKYPFMEFVDAVERRFCGIKDLVVWFDVFSVSQHKSGQRNFAWWNSTFLNAVGSMDELVMVVQPWHALIPLSRVWCIFETYAAEATHCHFSIAMRDAEASRLVETICKDPSTLFTTLRRMCCEASTASEAEDRDRIFDTVRQSVGFAQLDSMVTSRIAEAICDELSDQAKAAQNTGDLAGSARLLRALAQLRGLQRNHCEAERLHRECLKIAAVETFEGLEPNFSAYACLGIACACTRQGKGEEASEAYQSVLRAASLSRNHPVYLEATSGLALEFYSVPDKRFESDRLAKDCETFSVMNGATQYNLGNLRLAQGRAADAERIFRKGIDAWREEAKEWSPLMPWHPATLDAMMGVADAVERQKRQAEAEEGLRQVLVRLVLRERVLGRDHSDTVVTRARLTKLIGSMNTTERVG